MKKLFLSLDDAVRIAVREFDAEAVIARQEFMQKCFITDSQYNIGYNDGIEDAIKAIKQKIEGAES
jgi:uncharacterized protein (DUF2164 family)